jgi:hypothetical protein
MSGKACLEVCARGDVGASPMYVKYSRRSNREYYRRYRGEDEEGKGVGRWKASYEV